MTNIPEDSMLKRHYLTELKSQQDKRFQYFLDYVDQPKIENGVTMAEPIWSISTMVPAILFLFFLGVLFL